MWRGLWIATEEWQLNPVWLLSVVPAVMASVPTQEGKARGISRVVGVTVITQAPWVVLSVCGKLKFSGCGSRQGTGKRQAQWMRLAPVHGIRYQWFLLRVDLLFSSGKLGFGRYLRNASSIGWAFVWLDYVTRRLLSVQKHLSVTLQWLCQLRMS